MSRDGLLAHGPGLSRGTEVVGGGQGRPVLEPERTSENGGGEGASATNVEKTRIKVKDDKENSRAEARKEAKGGVAAQLRPTLQRRPSVALWPSCPAPATCGPVWPAARNPRASCPSPRHPERNRNVAVGTSPVRPPRHCRLALTKPRVEVCALGPVDAYVCEAAYVCARGTNRQGYVYLSSSAMPVTSRRSTPPGYTVYTALAAWA
jgi:hypothetical protein